MKVTLHIPTGWVSDPGLAANVLASIVGDFLTDEARDVISDYGFSDEVPRSFHIYERTETEYAFVPKTSG